MIGIRTPVKKVDGENRSPPKSGASPPNVRRSVGEWEAAKSANTDSSPPLTTRTVQAGPSKVAKTIISRTQSADTSPKSQYADRSAEARACLNRAKLHLSSSRNTKTEIKNGITEALDRMFQLVKEAEREAKLKTAGGVKERKEPEITAIDATFSVGSERNTLATTIEEHSKLLLENNKRMEELKALIEQQKVNTENGVPTYASVAASHGGKPNPVRSTLHSIVVTSNSDTETGDQVLDKIRKAVDAKEGWVKVERVRKAKDRKIIMGFQTKEERSKIKDRLEKESQDLNVEEVKNKDPLLILKSVLSVNSDEDVLKAMRNQNKDVFHNLDKEEDRMEVKFRRKTRNPHTNHVVVSVSPTIWRRATEAGCLHMDRRFCKEPAVLCSHCGRWVPSASD